MQRKWISGRQPPQRHRRRLHGGPISAHIRGGLELAEEALAAFFEMPAAADIAAGHELARVAAGLGLRVLQQEERQRLPGRVDRVALKLAAAAVRTLLRSPDGEAASGQQGRVLGAARAKLLALGQRFSAALDQAERAVGDGKLVLEAWQYGAQATILQELLRAITDPALPEAEKRLLLEDAAGVLGEVEAQVQQWKKVREHDKRGKAAAAAELLAEQKEQRLLETMQELREGKQVDPAALQEMAEYYAERTAAELE